jgi:hypothetical protein
VLISELEGLEEPQSLVDAATDGEIAGGVLSQLSTRKGEGGRRARRNALDTLVFKQDAVVARDAVRLVTQEREADV